MHPLWREYSVFDSVEQQPSYTETAFVTRAMKHVDG